MCMGLTTPTRQSIILVQVGLDYAASFRGYGALYAEGQNPAYCLNVGLLRLINGLQALAGLDTCMLAQTTTLSIPTKRNTYP